MTGGSGFGLPRAATPAQSEAWISTLPFTPSCSCCNSFSLG